MNLRSCIYRGNVVHARLRPRRHKLHYRVFSLLLDLDELPTIAGHLRLLGFNAPAILSVHESDHGDGRARGLRGWVDEQLVAAGIETGDLRVEMLCYPRMFGYVFNPLTIYFCRDPEGQVRALLYEVCNTFGERHTYVYRIDSSGQLGAHQGPKLHYVSPFVPMDCVYRFSIETPGEHLLVRIDEMDAEGLLLRASLSGRRVKLDDRGLLAVLFGYPLMTFKVMAAIHWEALRLWLKGMRVYRHSRADTPSAVTVISPPSAQHAAGNREAQPRRKSA